MNDVADPRDTAQHPRRRTSLIGHEAAEARLLHNFRAGRLHHAWLITGPRGIGKATLGYRLARFLLHRPTAEAARDAQSLHVPADAPAARRMASGGHPDLLVLERAVDLKTKRLRAEVVVDDARAVPAFFAHTAGAGGWRICIVDPTDDLNQQSANTLLKTLEEPPARALFILISHQPGGLLPTIRSRCLPLPLKLLTQEQTVAVVRDVLEPEAIDAGLLDKAARLSGGSPGRALELLGSAGAALFDRFLTLAKHGFHTHPALKLQIAGDAAARGSIDDFNSFAELLVEWAAVEARERSLKGRGDGMARAHDQICHSLRLVDALNLDRRQAVLDAFHAIEAVLRMP